MARSKAPRIGQKITVTHKGTKITGKLHAIAGNRACLMTKVGNLDVPVWVPSALLLK